MQHHNMKIYDTTVQNWNVQKFTQLNHSNEFYINGIVTFDA